MGIRMSNGLLSDAEFEKLLGEPLNSGGARIAFDLPSKRDAVVKKVHVGFVGTNIIEWIVWNAVQESKWEIMFGRCHAISPTGTYLMMERLNDLPADKRKKLPKLPDWVRDAWPNNFGINRDGEIKMRDYANIDFRSALLREETIEDFLK
jgi:hypothetical protein